MDERESRASGVPAGAAVRNGPDLSVLGMHQAHRRTAPEYDEIGLGGAHLQRVRRLRILNPLHHALTADRVLALLERGNEVIAKFLIVGRINNAVRLPA